MIQLGDGRSIKRALVMNEKRIELVGFGEDERPFLKSIGVVTEIMSFKLRLFIPVNDEANGIIARIRAQMA